jgi:hypothetical protein
MKTGKGSIILCTLTESVLAFGAGCRGSMPVWFYLLISSVVVLGAKMLLSFPNLPISINLLRHLLKFEND